MPEGQRFALYVSAIEGKPVTRFGTRTLIGASRSRATPNVVDYDTQRVVAIPQEEYSRFRREYDRALGNGSLRRRKAEEWQAQHRHEKRKEQQGAGTPAAPPVAPKAQE